MVSELPIEAEEPPWVKRLIKNLTESLRSSIREESENSSDGAYNESENAWMYILFVLMFYAFSIVVLMVKYIRREREGAKLEYYYNEFVKREWYRDKNLVRS